MKTSHSFLIFIPAILFVAFILFIRIVQYEPLVPDNQKTLEEQQKERSVIPIFNEDPLLGDKKAAHTVILFSDFGCEACKNEFGLLKQIIRESPQKVKVIWKGLPVKKFPFDSEMAEKYGFCASKQGKFEQWADSAFENNDALSTQNLIDLSKEIGLDQNNLQACLDAKTTADYMQKTKDLASVLKVQAVPAVFLDNNQITAPKILEDWKAALSL